MNNLIILILFIGWALIYSWITVSLFKLVNNSTSVHFLVIPLIFFVAWLSTVCTWNYVRDLDLLQVLQNCVWLIIMLSIVYGCVKLMQKIYNNR